MELEMRRSLTH